MSHSCHGYISSWAFRVRCFGGPSLKWESGRSWDTGCWIQTLHSPGKIWGCEFLLKCTFLCQGGAYGERVSQPFLLFLMWVFFFFSSFAQCVGVTQLVSGFLSERISQCVGVDLVCLSEFRSFLCCHLSPKPLNSFCLFIIVLSFFFLVNSLIICK